MTRYRHSPPHASMVTNSERSAWFIGGLLLMVYLIFAMTLFLLPPGGP